MWLQSGSNAAKLDSVMKAKSTSQINHRELAVSELRATCDPSSLPCETTNELETLSDMIGQDRASRAIQFGLGMKSFGYNLFVAGTPGTGKKTLIRSLVVVSTLGEKSGSHSISENW